MFSSKIGGGKNWKKVVGFTHIEEGKGDEWMRKL